MRRGVGGEVDLISSSYRRASSSSSMLVMSSVMLLLLMVASLPHAHRLRRMSTTVPGTSLTLPPAQRDPCFLGAPRASLCPVLSQSHESQSSPEFVTGERRDAPSTPV